MIRLDLSPLAIAVLGSALVMLAVLGAWLAACWVNRRPRRDARPSTTIWQKPEPSLDADWMRSQLQALLRSQAQLHDKLSQQHASLTQISDWLRQAPAQPVAPVAGRRDGPAHPDPMDTTAAPRSAPAPARAGALAAGPAPAPVAIATRPPISAAAPIPLPRAGPRIEAEEPEAELSDEEIDALPPELPVVAKTTKRILAPPKKPTLQNL